MQHPLTWTSTKITVQSVLVQAHQFDSISGFCSVENHKELHFKVLCYYEIGIDVYTGVVGRNGCDPLIRVL